MSTDVLTLSEAKQSLSIETTDNEYDTLLQSFISSISQRLDQVCGPIVTRTVTEYRDGGTSKIWLREAPVASITSVTEYSGVTPQVLTRQTPGIQPDGYTIDFSQGRLTRVSGGLVTFFKYGIENIAVVYEAGRSETTAEVDDLFKRAASSFLNHVWKTEQGMGTETYGGYEGGSPSPTFSLPNRVKDLLGNEIKPGAIA